MDLVVRKDATTDYTDLRGCSFEIAFAATLRAIRKVQVKTPKVFIKSGFKASETARMASLNWQIPYSTSRAGLQMHRDREFFKDSAVLIATGTGFLYAAGTAYYGGFLNTLLLNPNILDRNFHQVMYQGFLVSIVPLLVVFAVFFSSIMIYAHIVLPLWLKLVRNNFARQRRLLKFIGPLRIRKTTSEAEVRAVRATIYLGKLFAFAYLFLFLLLHLENNGREAAEAFLVRVETGEVKETSFVTAHTSKGEFRLIAMTCGARNCAGLDQSTGEVIYYPQGFASFKLITEDDVGSSASAD